MVIKHFIPSPERVIIRRPAFCLPERAADAATDLPFLGRFAAVLIERKQT